MPGYADYREMLWDHLDADADITIGVKPCTETEIAEQRERVAELMKKLSSIEGDDARALERQMKVVNPRRLARQVLAEVVEPRFEELFNLIQAEVRRAGLEDLTAAGVVLTGGSSRMEGVAELAEEVFHAQVRVGMPDHLTGMADVVRNPMHATGVGLLLYGADNAGLGLSPASSGGVRSVWDRMKSWFQSNF